jgi:hypothetical protein
MDHPAIVHHWRGITVFSDSCAHSERNSDEPLRATIKKGGEERQTQREREPKRREGLNRKKTLLLLTSLSISFESPQISLINRKPSGWSFIVLSEEAI